MTPDQFNILHERLGGVDSKLDRLQLDVSSIDRRVKGLEWWKAKVAGVAVAVTFFANYFLRKHDGS